MFWHGWRFTPINHWDGHELILTESVRQTGCALENKHMAKKNKMLQKVNKLRGDESRGRGLMAETSLEIFWLRSQYNPWRLLINWRIYQTIISSEQWINNKFQPQRIEIRRLDLNRLWWSACSLFHASFYCICGASTDNPSPPNTQGKTIM